MIYEIIIFAHQPDHLDVYAIYLSISLYFKINFYKNHMSDHIYNYIGASTWSVRYYTIYLSIYNS